MHCNNGPTVKSTKIATGGCGRFTKSPLSTYHGSGSYNEKSQDIINGRAINALAMKNVDFEIAKDHMGAWLEILKA